LKISETLLGPLPELRDGKAVEIASKGTLNSLFSVWEPASAVQMSRLQVLKEQCCFELATQPQFLFSLGLS
jgi:hypothetical protein